MLLVGPSKPPTDASTTGARRARGGCDGTCRFHRQARRRRRFHLRKLRRVAEDEHAADAEAAACHILQSLRRGCPAHALRQFRPVVRAAVPAARSRHVGLCGTFLPDARLGARQPRRSVSLSAERLDDAPAGRGENRLHLEYRIETPAIVARRQDAELSLGQFSNVVRECCGRNWSPLEIHFEHPRPAEWRQHETAFGAPVFFSCCDQRHRLRPGHPGEADARTRPRNCLP